MIEHLWDTTARIDILYICSNQAIAAQNLNRLNVLGRRELALPTRMTLSHYSCAAGGYRRQQGQFHQPDAGHHLRSPFGHRRQQERALLQHLLDDLVSPLVVLNLLQVTAGVDGWNRAVDSLDLDGVDTRIIDRFRREVQADSDLFQDLERVCDMFPRRRDVYPAE